MIHFKANTRRAVALSDDLITTGSAGIEVEILCSDAWEGLTKTVLFRGSGSSVDLVLSGCSCTVPPEVLTVPGGQLLIGLYGSDGSGNLAIPTVWADAGRILQGAEPSGIAPTPAQKSALDQAIEALQTATAEIPSQIDTALAEAKASGEFDGVGVPTGGTAGQVLAKASGTDYDTEWVDQSGGDSGAAYFPFTISDGTVIPGTGVTPQAIYQAYTDGKAVFAVIEPELEIDNDQILPLEWINERSGTYSIWFSVVYGQISFDLYFSVGSWRTQSMTLYQKPFTGIPKFDLASDIQTSLGKADTALQSYTETDPTVPSWAKASSKPSYTAAEVGAVAANQGAANAGKFLKVATDGSVVPTSEAFPPAQVQEAVDTWLNQHQSQIDGIPQTVKIALLQLAQKVAYIDDQGQTYYDDLYDALYPPANLMSITATYTQSGTVYDTDTLNSLKADLVVTAHYSDSSTQTVAAENYTLSGSLTVGSSTVTVIYQSKTTTFTVNVTARPTLSSISAVYTQSGAVYGTDTLDSLKTDLVVTAHYSDSSTQTVPAADYTLSGTLTAGTSTITVSYGGKTTTFSVTVSEEPIPSDYQQVEYLEATQKSATSGGYFNTGVNSPEHTTLQYVVGFMPSGTPPTANTKQSIIGTRKTSTGNTNDIGFSMDVRSDNAAIGAFSGISVYFEEPTINQRFDLTATWTATGLTINNGSSTESAEGETRGCVGYPICVFGLKKAANTMYTNTFNGRIYYAKVYADGELIVDMVPCYRKSDNVVGMYNKATGSFRTVTGSAAVFTAGPDVT